MTHVSLAKYTAIIRINLRERATYSLDVLSKAPQVMFRLWIMFSFYGVVLQTQPAAAATTTLNQLLWTLTILQAFSGRGHPRIAEIINDEVKSGLIAYSINRPYSYLLFQYCNFLGKSLPVIAARLIAGSIAALFFVGLPSTSPTALLAGTLLLIGGFTLDFFIGLSIGILSFWIEDSVALDMLYSKILLVLGGFLVPLSLFPPTLRSVLEYSPFSQLAYSAGYLITHFQWPLFYRYCATQALWIAISWLCAYWLFKRGMRHVAINGG